MKHSQIRALRDIGEIEAVRRSVWRFASAGGAPDAAITGFLACWPAAVISHASAAVFHGLSRVAAPSLPEVTAPAATTCRPAGVRVHHSTALVGGDVLSLGTLRYTSLARTVLDLADGDDPWETLALVDDAVAAGASRRWLHARATALWRGRDGVALVRAVTHPDAAAEFRSWLERTTAHIFAVCGMPAPLWNVEVRDRRGRIGTVDALWPEWRVVVELKGLRFHAAPRDVVRDDRRVNRLLDAGYQVRQFSWTDVVHTPADVVGGVVRALRAAGAGVDTLQIPAAITLPHRPFGAR